MEHIGIIGGSGFYELLENPRMFIHDNKYGRSSEMFEGTIDGVPVYFLPRHGPNHKVIVPRINYRANIWAFKELGVKRIFATNSVGSCNEEMKVGDFVIPDDFVDFTRRSPRSLYDDMTTAIHVDMSPSSYCPDLRKALIDASRQVRPNNTHDHGVIFVNEGLRYETPYELKIFKMLGCDLIGMTTLPEAVFAREAAICYAHICVPVNYCFGQHIDANDFPRILAEAIGDFKKILTIAIKNVPQERDCCCAHALDNALLEKVDEQ